MGMGGTCFRRSIALTHRLKDVGKPWVGAKQSPPMLVDEDLAYLLHVKLQEFLNDFIISGAHFMEGFDLIIGKKNLLTTTSMPPDFVSRLLTDLSAPPLVCNVHGVEQHSSKKPHPYGQFLFQHLCLYA
jgi:hypothetical protein